MAKVKTTFYCQNCGTAHLQWQGQCNACKSWNTLVEEVVRKTNSNNTTVTQFTELQGIQAKPQRLDEVKMDETQRFSTQNKELDTVLGGGIVPGAVILLGGEPGIGKSTLLLQIALQMPQKILYVSGEESASQIKMRAMRLGFTNPECLLLTETQTEAIFTHLNKEKPDLVIVDSIQTLYTEMIESAAGSVSQVKASAAQLIQFAKSTLTPILLIGHITKEGSLAGPKVLEHMVDTVLQFEGDRNQMYRLLRTQKNRFGATHELALFEMQTKGLRSIINPSEILLSPHSPVQSGTAVAVTLEGTRPLLVEVQALVSTAVYSTPQRSANGFNFKRLQMLLAVLEKRGGFKFGTKDVFLNITGGISSDDPALDLAVILAILSSHLDMPLPQQLCAASEVGLGGELRAVVHLDKRIQEASKLGFKSIVLANSAKVSSTSKAIKTIRCKKIAEVITTLFS